MRPEGRKPEKQKVLMLASVASMISQFNMPNIRLLQEMGYEVHTACNFKEGNTFGREQIRKFQAQLDTAGAVRHQWDCPRDIRPVKKCCRAYLQLCRLLERERFAFIHCHSPVGGALARLAARRYGVPVIYTAHGFHFYKGAPLLNWMLYYPAERLLARWTDVLITINKEDYGTARRRLKAGKVCYTPGVGIDIEKYSRSPAEQTLEISRGQLCRKYNIPEHALVLLSVGELSRRKNHREVLEALARLRREDVYYLICGQGSFKETLAGLAEKWGIRDQVRMPGFQEDMAGLYAAADIFVFPSLQEGMPAALIEAMASGLPCIVSDIRGNRELIPKPFRFPPEHTEKLCRMLEKLLDDETVRSACGRRNQEKSRKYDWKRVRNQMRRIYGK